MTSPTPLDSLDAFFRFALANWEGLVLLVAAFVAVLLAAVQSWRLARLRRQLANRHWLADRTLSVAITSSRAARRTHGGLRMTSGGPERTGRARGPNAALRAVEQNPADAQPPQQFRMVKIYIDHSNFYQYWKQLMAAAPKGPGGAMAPIDWAKLPEALLVALRRIPEFANQEFVYCGAHVYGSYYDNRYYDLLLDVLSGKLKAVLPLNKKPEQIEGWRADNRIIERDLVDDLPQKFGFFVFPFRRRTPQQLKSAHYSASGVPLAQEKGVDVRLCTDLMADAVFDVFDIALVISNDADFIPAVEFVQSELGKAVVHVGFRQFASALRDTCRANIVLNDSQNVAQTMRRAAE